MLRRMLALALAVTAGLLGSLLATAPATAQEVPKILVFSKTAGFRHDSIPAGISAVRQLGAENGFAVDATEDAAAFTAANLAQYDAVVWLSTTGDVLNASQEAAFESYIEAGGGYAGVHAAADTEYGWSWYGGLVGAYFQSHPAIQQATVDVEDATHPSTRDVPAEWVRTDEWYSYRSNPRSRTHVLATLDESTYSGGGMGADHPIAWCHAYDGGRSWYTGMGHTGQSYAEDDFLEHVLGGIRYAAGLEAADCTAPEPEPDECTATGSDEFGGDALDTALWSTRVRENPDTYEVRDGALRITTENGDLWMGGGNVKNLLLQPAPGGGDWQVSTQLTIDATGGSEQAGLILYAGDDDYIKLNHIGRNGAKWFEFIYESGGSPRFEGQQDRSPDLPVGFPTTMQLRLTSESGQITGAYSIDGGQSWTAVGRPVAAGALTDPKVGVFALTNQSEFVTEAAFDWFHVSGAGTGGPDDEFDGDALDCPWTEIVRENPDNYEVADGALRITTANGDLYGGGGDVENIVLQPAPGGTWEATTELTIDATGGAEQGGLILYSGDDDYAKIAHVARDGEKWFEFLVESGGQPRFDGSLDRTANLPDGFTTTFQLKLTYDAGTLTAAYSLDGETWTPVGRPADVGGFPSPKIGPFAQTNSDAEITVAAFDWFHLDGATGEDTTPPSVRAAVDGLPTSDGSYLGTATVALTATDLGSGVETVEYAIGDGDWQAYDEPLELGAGEHTVRHRATDAAGNTSGEGTIVVTVTGDLGCEPAASAGPGYVPIFDGTVGSLDGWRMAGPGGFDANADCTIDAWGGMGLLWYAAQELDSPYTVRAEWKIYADDDNSGVFIGFPDPGDDPWQPVSQGYEIQIDPTDEAVRTTGAVYSFQAPDEAARAAALNPHGEWNVMEVSVDGTQITIRLNGTVINEYTSPHPERSPMTGFVGIQNDGAGRDVTYRSVQLRNDGADTTAPTVGASLEGEQDGAGTYTGPVTVTLDSEDADLESIEYALDGGEWTAYDAPFEVDAPGAHSVRYRATDAAGNVSEPETVQFTIADDDGEQPDAPSVEGFADPATGAAPLQVQFSAAGLDPQGGEVTYEWRFGDGAGSSNQSARHTYTTPGTYTATVTATDPQGETGTDTVQITVTSQGNQAPVVAAAAEPVSGVAPTEVRFSARATDPDGQASEITYLWDFDDDGANEFGRTARHTYMEAGTYTATVTATDAGGAFDTAEVEVVVGNPPGNVAPDVQAAATPRSGTAPLQVHFSSATTDPDGDRVSTVWDFGDGGQAGGSRATHTYTSPGTYTATVTATDPGGKTDTATVQITVTGAGPFTPPVTGQQGTPPPQVAAPEPPQGGVQGESESRPLVKAPRSQKVRRVKRRGLRLKVACPERCNVRTVLTHSGRRIGRSRTLRIRDGRTHTVKVRLNRRLRRNLLATMRQAGVRSLRATAVTTVRTADGTQTIRRTVRLKR